MKMMSEYIAKLENLPDLEVSIIRVTKINKVLKAILKLESIPKESEFTFKPRSQALLDKWTKILNDNESGAAPAPASASAPEAGANGVNGSAEEKKEEKVERAEEAESAPAAEPESNGVKEEASKAEKTEKVEETAVEKPEKDAEQVSSIHGQWLSLTLRLTRCRMLLRRPKRSRRRLRLRPGLREGERFTVLILALMSCRARKELRETVQQAERLERRFGQATKRALETQWALVQEHVAEFEDFLAYKDRVVSRKKRVVYFSLYTTSLAEFKALFCTNTDYLFRFFLSFSRAFIAASMIRWM